MRVLSLALKFVVELAAFAAFAYWGASLGSGAVSVALAIAVPSLAIVALLAAGAPVAAVVMAVLAATSAALLTGFDQWEA